jgi:hypothetical protein
MKNPEFPTVLRDALIELRSGRAATRSEGAVPGEAAQFGAVFLGGGHWCVEEFRRSQPAWPWPVILSRDGNFVGEAGGLDLLAAHSVTGLVVDLGQTGLKVSDGIRRWHFPRDWNRLPMRNEVPVDRYPDQRRELRRFLAESVGQCAAESTIRVDALVVALPARLDDTGIPEGSSYAGMAGDEALVTDALVLGDLEKSRVWLLNDAELAALSAQLHPELPKGRSTLVLTLGFGLGTALVKPCP